MNQLIYNNTMSEFIRCPECSFCIGLYSEFVEKAKQAIYASVLFNEKSQYKDYDPDKMAFNSSIMPDLEPLFTSLNIKNRCCRMHLTTKNNFDKLYK